MSRARRRRTTQEQEPVAPPATWRDGTVVVAITNTGVEAIIAEAGRLGLEDGYWSAEQLYPRVAEIIARALRATPGWWVGRTPEKA